MAAPAPAEPPPLPGVPRQDSPIPPVTGVPAARAWLDVEQANPVATAGYAAGPGWPRDPATLAETRPHHLETGGHHTASLAAYPAAPPPPRDQGEPSAAR